MDISKSRLDNIESQDLTDVSRVPKRQIYLFLENIIEDFFTIRSHPNRREYVPEPTKNIDSLAEFLANHKWSDLFDVPGEYKQMNVEMLSNLNERNEEWLEQLRSHETPLACLKNDRGYSVLHLATTWNHLKLVKKIISECPCLLLEPNSKDQLPIHVAARDGRFAVAEVLIASINFFVAKLGEEDREIFNPYLLKDINGDTALRLALKGNHIEVAHCLVNTNQQASFLASEDGISSLYFAVEIGNLSLVKKMLENDSREMPNFHLEGTQYIVHAALKSMNTDVLHVILNKCSNLVDVRDEEGRTCLSFAAFLGYYEGVCKLLDLSTKGAFVCDDDGSYPIHMAVKNGNINIVKEIMKRCPYSKYLLNKEGQNILHIIAKIERPKILSHLTKFRRAYRQLASEQDVDGNTPLHLATMKWHSRSILWLARIENLSIRNKSGLTALDIAEANLQPNYIYKERSTLNTLVRIHLKRYLRYTHTVKATRPIMPVAVNKEFVNALLIVAALIATVSFTAGFTLPGGTKETTPKLGIANLISNPKLFYFLIFDVLALESSILAIVSLMVAQLGDPALYGRSIWVAMISLFFALCFMNFAFLCVMVIAIGQVKWVLVGMILLIVSASIFTLNNLQPHLVLHSRCITSSAQSDIIYHHDSVEDGK